MAHLTTELETYKSNVEAWIDHVGEFVVIRGDKVIGFYSSYADAVQVGYGECGLEPFLVKQVRVIENTHFVPLLMRAANGALHAAD